MIPLPRPLAVLTRLGFTVLAGSSLLAAAGCATPAALGKRDVVFSIPYMNDCPGVPTSNFPCSGATDCAHLQGGNATVQFKAIGTGSATRQFTVRFDPFGMTSIESGANGATIAFPVPKAHSEKNTSPKEFTFFILDKDAKKNCAQVDPRIIVEK